MSRIEEVISLAEMMYQESPFSKLQEGHVIADTLNACAANGSLFIEVVDDKVVGFLAGLHLAYHPIIGPCSLAAELAWYVHPDYRKQGLAVKLLDAFEKWASLVGATHSTTSAMFNSSFEQVKSLYEKRGYTMIEASFIKEVK